MEMVLIRAPPSGLIIKAVCISLYLRKPQMPWHPELTHANVRLLNLTIFCVGKPSDPLTWRSQLLSVFFRSLISLSEIAGGDWSLFRSCHRIASEFTLPLLHSAVFSVPFGRNNSWRWERSKWVQADTTDRQECQGRCYLFWQPSRQKQEKANNQFTTTTTTTILLKNIDFSKHIL